MEAADVDEVARVAADAFEFDLSDPETRQRWRDRFLLSLGSDADGSFVADRDGRVIGVGQALVRERLWVLSLLTVDPGVQSAGTGRALLERTLETRGGTDCGLIVASNDSRAMRLYARAGFTMLPTLQTEGALRRASLPRPDPRVREGALDDIEPLAALSREVRGGPHTSELRFALKYKGRLLLIPGRGFTVVLPGVCVWLLVARDEEAAQALLWAGLADVGDSEQTVVRWITAAQQWAIRVVVEAGFRLSAYGALCVAGSPGTLAPYLPSGPFA